MNKKKDIVSQLSNGTLTESMDFGSKEYEDFKLLIRSKVNETSKDDRIRVALLGLKYQMEDDIQSDKVIAEVGSFIKQFISLVEVKQVEFAKYLKILPSNLSKILNGERRVTLELSIILERLSNIDAELWLRIQNRNELTKINQSNNIELNKYKLKELIS